MLGDGATLVRWEEREDAPPSLEANARAFSAASCVSGILAGIVVVRRGVWRENGRAIESYISLR